MIEQAGRFIGMLAADVVNLFRGRQLVPCTVEWPEDGVKVYIGPAVNWTPTMAELSTKMTRTYGLTNAKLSESECCDSCEHGCWSPE